MPPSISTRGEAWAWQLELKKTIEVRVRDAIEQVIMQAQAEIAEQLGFEKSPLGILDMQGMLRDLDVDVRTLREETLDQVAKQVSRDFDPSSLLSEGPAEEAAPPRPPASEEAAAPAPQQSEAGARAGIDLHAAETVDMPPANAAGGITDSAKFLKPPSELDWGGLAREVPWSRERALAVLAEMKLVLEGPQVQRRLRWSDEGFADFNSRQAREARARLIVKELNSTMLRWGVEPNYSGMMEWAFKLRPLEEEYPEVRAAHNLIFEKGRLGDADEYRRKADVIIGVRRRGLPSHRRRR